MILDANAYRINIPAIKAWREQRPDEPMLKAISAIAVAYGIPIIVVCHYLGALEGYSEELTCSIERLMAFYSVDKVIGI